jgi:DnaJ family protein C protein 13
MKQGKGSGKGSVVIGAGRCGTVVASQVLAAQRSGAAPPELATLQSFTFTSLAGELQVGGVFIRVFNARGMSGASASDATVTAATTAAPGAPGSAAATATDATAKQLSNGQPQDPSGFCKALVRYLYDRLVERCFRGSELHLLPVVEAVRVADVLQALLILLDSEPRLLGLLSSKSAVSPLVACLTPAAASYPPLFDVPPPAGNTSQLSPSGDSSSQDALAATAEQLAALGLQLLIRSIANAAVQEVVTDESLLRQLYWLTVQPPSMRVLQGCLGLLRRLSGCPMAAAVAGYQGGAVLLLAVLLHTGR